MSSMNPTAANSETKTKSGNDPSAHQGGDSSANSQDPNKSKTVRSDDNLNETSKEAEEDCEECSFSRFIKRGSCKDAFIEVDNCVDDNDTKCRDARLKLNTCMYANVDYYGEYLSIKKESVMQASKRLETFLKELETAEEAAAVAMKKEEEETKGK